VIPNRKELARQALSSALKTRVRAARNLWDPICIYDVAEKIEVEVRFLDVPSMEGLYCKQPGPLILLPSERPPGRQAYSCAHELGHHVAGHGTGVDELLDEKSNGSSYGDNPDEFLVECYAGFLLMPKSAVERALTCRGWKLTALTGEQAYTIAGLFGVGYSTLVNHLRWSLGILAATKAEELLRMSPKQIRRHWLEHDTSNNVVVLDRFWVGRPIDLKVGDFVVAPKGIEVESPNLQLVRETRHGIILETKQPGIGRLSIPAEGWANFVRVSRSAYVGLAKYRHLEDAADA